MNAWDKVEKRKRASTEQAWSENRRVEISLY